MSEKESSPGRQRPAPASELADRWKLAAADALIEPWRWFFHPVFHGIDLVPDRRPLLFVGNHTLYGMIDIPLLFDELWRRKGIFLRGLADRGHYYLPVWRDLLTSFGAVEGTRENCAELMRSGEALVVFPGGGREVAKRRGEKYKLLWKERMGFARLAIEHGATVVPFASIGVEDAYDIVFDAEDLKPTLLGRALLALGVREDTLMPLARGIGPTLIPRPARIYFRICEPIATDLYGGNGGDPASVRELRDRTHDAIEAAIAELRREQGRDPEAVRFATAFGPIRSDD